KEGREMENTPIVSLDARVTRLGIVLQPNGDPDEAEGILNPAAVRTRDGKLLLYPRMVSAGNCSRIGIVEVGGSADAPTYTRAGFALEPREPYELRTAPGGQGCEDPRVTFMPSLDSYVMAYTAYGPEGPRVAVATSHDGYEWERLGLADFSAPGLPCGDDKDAAFFPEPVLSPKGQPSFAFFHRPMLHISSLDGEAALPFILDMPARDRESTRVAYVPLEPALADRKKLLSVSESVIVLEPAHAWGRVKNGAGTPPVRIEEGWLSFFHGVDGLYDRAGKFTGMRYSAGMLVQDLERPDIVRFRSPEPLLTPESPEERIGVVHNVVFPTGIDRRPGSAPREYDVYYGMADRCVGRFHVELGASVMAKSEAEESAA
ncbi:MAG TPA: hypothetical protein VKG44_09905, partial [Candidatus Baltobacteraceae bacterium]|nr:hypothetical protein [Candidatus Baltobacteraceae bacterium]